jgi:hypothetical protein
MWNRNWSLTKRNSFRFLKQGNEKEAHIYPIFLVFQNDNKAKKVVFDLDSKESIRMLIHCVCEWVPFVHIRTHTVADGKIFFSRTL